MRAITMLIALLASAGMARAQRQPAGTEVLVHGIRYEELDDIEVSLMGREQGGNDFRADTPALQRVQRRAATVNTDVLYRQKLALYGEAAPAAPVALLAPSTRPADSVDEPRTEAPARTLFWFALLSAVAMFIGLLVWGVRRAAR